MDDGFYWISFRGIVQIAFLSNEPVEDIDRGVAATGVWFLTGEKGEVCGMDDVKVLSAKLAGPDETFSGV
jgi:threonine/homoserine efflux transporter RhtA